ncbi:ABC transporter ATP-binding protein [Pseudoalteromonas luteoviolacea B = ATCC 29581]|nr:ABC transporter ATP-binding protein [Pseudoalteromonas luteoviolacea B = ATCC 29581]
MLEIHALSHQYKKDHFVLADINLSLEKGVVGLLGKNGAGKSSLMNILATIIKPSQGDVTYHGVSIVKKPQSIREVLGYLPQYFGVYDELSAVEFLHYIANLKKLSPQFAKQQIASLLDSLNLAHVANTKLGSYSGGMRQRIGIAQALLNDPKVLIIDEPTVGLDPEERNEFKNLLSEMAAERLILLSTHIVSDIASIAQQVAIMRQGNLAFFGTPTTLQSQFQGEIWQAEVDFEQYNEIKRKGMLTHAQRQDVGYFVRCIAKERPFDAALSSAPTLEDAYLAINKNHRGAMA